MSVWALRDAAGPERPKALQEMAAEESGRTWRGWKEQSWKEEKVSWSILASQAFGRGTRCTDSTLGARLQGALSAAPLRNALEHRQARDTQHQNAQQPVGQPQAGRSTT